MVEPGHPSLAERVAEAWVRGKPPDLVRLLGLADPVGPSGASNGGVIDAIVEDAEQRQRRGLPSTLEHYRQTVPDRAADAEVVRALLMLECARRSSEPVDAVWADLRRRFPELGDQIDAVAEMALLMRSAAGTVMEALGNDVLSAGDTLGKYRLVHWLGAGSFGEVWSAWDTRLERYVALKLLPPDSADRSMLSAVIREAKAAACIDHENVVKVHDAGRFDAPERCYIDAQLAGDPGPSQDDPRRVAVGRPLSALVAPEAGAGVAPREAARLMSAVCSGVAAAHARGIVHRDIKPSNIIVTPSGRPMLSDFGLSVPQPGQPGRMAGASATMTGAGGRITGTPAFMSPEQARGEPATPASDVYSLGATLRFLLTGTLPFQPSGRYTPDAPWDVIEQVKRGEAVPLSLARPDLPRDLSAVCDRAMEPDAQRRYLSAEAMGADLRAYIEHRPVSARASSPPRRAVMWARRNTAVVSLSAVMLVLGAVGLWRYVVNIGRERDRAVAAEAATLVQLAQTEKARASADAVNQFLQSVISAADPGVLGKDARMLDAVRLASREIEPRLRGHPELEGDVRATVGLLYDVLDDNDAARANLDRALELRRIALGENAPPTLRMRHALVKLDCDQTHSDGSLVELEQLVGTMRREIGNDHEVTLSALHTLSAEYATRHRFGESLELLNHIVSARRNALGPDHPDVLEAERTQAAIRLILGDIDGGLAQFQSVLNRYDASLGPDYIERHRTATDLAFCFQMMGRYEESANLFLQSLAGLIPLLPPGHEMILENARPAANILAMDLDRPAEAVLLLEPVALHYLSRPDRAHMYEASCHHVLGMCYLRVGRVPEAEALLRRSRSEYIALTGTEDNDVVRAADKLLAQAYDALGLSELACEHRQRSGSGGRMPSPRGH